MQGRPAAPVITLVALASIAMVLAVVASLVAVNQPWLGLALEADAGPGLLVRDVDPRGPSSGLEAGARILAIDSDAAPAIVLEPFDLVDDPDTASSYAEMDRFFARQAQIAEALRSGTVRLNLADGQSLAVTPARSRPITSLPVTFWVLLAIGVIGAVIGGWTLALRPDDFGARLLAACTGALLVSCYPPAIYLHRELALPGSTFFTLSALNIFGAMAFVVGLLALFLSYPRRLVGPAILLLAAAVMLAIWLADTWRFGFAGPGEGRYLPISIAVLAALAAAVWQYRVARGDPHTRAAILWFALSVATGTGVYIIGYTIPILAGDGGELPSVLGYALAIPIFAGIGIGIVRYRLFDLEAWALRILFYLMGAALLVGLDVLLVSVLTLDHVQALGLSLGVVALFYLPLRDVLARRLLPQQPDRGQLLQSVVDAALAPAPAQRDARWQEVLRRAFNPLRLEADADGRGAPGLSEDGLVLLVPGHAGLAGVRLGYANGGRRLFTPADVVLVTQLLGLLVHSIESRDAYEKGAQAERGRIARDMHDNIGARLLSALHSRDPERKDAMVREAIGDLRGIVNNLAGTSHALDEVQAELRLETAERLAGAGLRLDWHWDAADDGPVTPAAAHALRSILREAVSNAIRHAGAACVRVTISQRDGRLTLAVSDDGRGLEGAGTKGSGLAGMRSRLATLGGTLTLEGGGPGLALVADFSCVEGNAP